jgi:hypothetical protein
LAPLRFLPAVLSLLLLFPEPGRAQEWNSPRALELVAEAMELRHTNVRDPDFQSYSSQARGYVHFFLEREDTGERILVKTDQIALEVYWAAPDRVKQRIVGLRDEESLPTDIQYHLDHLVVVQDEFGDLIRVGGGDEVESVLHPMAPSSETFYDFLLADSVTLTLQGVQEPIRVYEIQVRPKNFEIPGFIGSVFVDRASAAIVRMNFTFTPSSYVDSYLDHIRISLENGLWLGKYWLPYRQQLEIRREVPFLDIPAGSIIEGWFEVGDYQINPSLPMALFRGPTVSAVPEAQRKAFPFEEGLHDHLDTQGLSPPPDMEEIRSLALSLAREEFLTGLGGLRLYLPQPVVSSGLRFNRAEGVFLGAGVSYAFSPSFAGALHGGFSFGRQRPAGELKFTGGERHSSSRISGFLNKPRDLGPRQAISGVLNSLSALALDEDYTDLFFVTGISASQGWAPGAGWRVDLTGRWESHRPARDEVSSDSRDPRFRPVLTTDRGDWKSVSLGVAVPTPWEFLSTRGEGLLGRFEEQTFGHVSGEMILQRSSLARGFDLRASLAGGAVLGTPPLQNLYLLGGRETIPGYTFRSRVGDRYWLLKAEAAKDILAPWIRLRVFGAAGGTGYGGDPLPPEWPQGEDSQVLISGGAGLGLGWDVLRLDLARGFREGGEWQVIFSVNHAFWPWL